MSDEGNATAKNGEARPGAVFTCASCGHVQELPAQLAGRQAKCPKCGQPGVVAAAHLPEPTIDDVKLDDLVEPSSAAPSAPRPATADLGARQGSLALDAAPTPVTAAGHLRHFFSGSLPVNTLAGLITGGHQLLVCAALSMLFLLGVPAAGLGSHALVLTLLPAVLGCVLLALNGRLSVAVGGPDPASVLAVFLLVGALGADLAAQPAHAAPTMLAALSLCGMLAGAAAVLLSRLGLAEGVRFLPAEVMGGMLAGFGLLLIKAWAGIMAASDPALAALAAQGFAESGHGLAQSVGAWGPAVAFALAYFVVHMSARGLLWPILLTALAIGAWNLLPLYSAHLPAQLAEALARQRGLTMMLDLRGSIGLFDPSHLAHIDWLALGARAELFAAAAAMAILPSLVRTPILESVLERDCDAGEQARLVGAASMLSGLLGALPSSLSLSGSLGMRALGATAPLAGFVCGLACLGFLLAGAPLLAHVPLFVPLGILLATGLIMPVSWMLRDARNPLSRKDDLRAAWASCLLVAVCGPVLGVFASLGLGAVLSLARAVGGGGVRMMQTGDVFHSNVDRSPSERRLLKERGGQILVLRLQGFLFLGTLYGLLGRMFAAMAARPAEAPLRFVLLDFGAVTGLGASAAIGFRRLEAVARQHRLVLFLTSVPLELEEHLERLGYRMDDENGVCRVALNLDYALEHCEDVLLSEAGALETKQHSLAEMLASSFPEPRLVPALMKCLERVEAPRKSRLIKQGDASDCLYFLESGKVHVELALPGGKLLRLKKMGPGTVFGEMGIYTSAPRSASVIATERCVAYKLSVERFRLIQEKAPQLAAAVNRFIVALLAERVAEENAKNRAAQL